ncbi:MAG: class I SAM-dependent methyltransferase [Candidatus Omnitrophica bacterium]|nr:class I SAM-dependent methyltransferase [Candidatus Omnitrophota bacterium]
MDKVLNTGRKKMIGIKDLSEMFDHPEKDLSGFFVTQFNNIDTIFREANLKEFSEYCMDVLKLINSSVITRTKEENLKVWNKGWEENLNALLACSDLSEVLRPKYFRGAKYLRYKKGLIVSKNPMLEHDLFTLVRDIIFRKYLSKCENIYEFGCGSCQNLLMLSNIFPDKRLYGMDWAPSSVKIVEALAKKRKLKIHGAVFDMMNPSRGIALRPKSAVLTVHALEQLGEDHGNLLSYLLTARPDIVVHYEPILEFYDQNNLLDYLAILYSKKRNYLSGFWTALCELERKGKIEIIRAKRPFLGGVIHEASLIVWRPV